MVTIFSEAPYQNEHSVMIIIKSWQSTHARQAKHASITRLFGFHGLPLPHFRAVLHLFRTPIQFYELTSSAGHQNQSSVFTAASPSSVFDLAGGGDRSGTHAAQWAPLGSGDEDDPSASLASFSASSPWTGIATATVGALCRGLFCCCRCLPHCHPKILRGVDVTPISFLCLFTAGPVPRVLRSLFGSATLVYSQPRLHPC